MQRQDQDAVENTKKAGNLAAQWRRGIAQAVGEHQGGLIKQCDPRQHESASKHKRASGCQGSPRRTAASNPIKVWSSHGHTVQALGLSPA